jgi:hypothetical protein
MLSVSWIKRMQPDPCKVCAENTRLQTKAYIDGTKLSSSISLKGELQRYGFKKLSIILLQVHFNSHDSKLLL